MAPIVDDLFNKGRLERKRRTAVAAEASAAIADLHRARQSLEQLGDLKRDLKALADEQASRRELDQRLLEAEAERRRAEFESRAALEERLETALQARREAEDELNRLRGRGEAAEEARQVLETRLHASLIRLERLSDELRRAEVRADELRSTISHRTETLNSAKKRLSVVETAAHETKAEYELVKRKYRSSQTLLERERAKSERLRLSNDSANSVLALVKKGWGYRLEARVRSLANHGGKIFRLGGSRRAELQARLRLIRESHLFDAEWYLQQYQDVAAAKIDPAQHFLDIGWREGRSPSAAFSTGRYLKRHADVAALGVNPLLHYLEHGRFEGREFFGTGVLAGVLAAATGKPRALKNTPLPLAAPVFQGSRKAAGNLNWRRSCHLIRNERSIVIDGLALGLQSDALGREYLESALADFSILSGEAGSVAAEPLSKGHVPDLTDGWFSTTRRLNTRWAVGEATVFRAAQHDPATGRLTIVGEGLATSPLDCVQFDLVAPMLPLLVVASTRDGVITGLVNLAFPSLLRGGHHYAEAVGSGSGNSRIDPIALSAALEQSLRTLRSGTAKPLVKKISVDLGGADASTPLFQRDLRDMLERVIGIGLAPLVPENADPRLSFVAASVTLKPRHSRSTGATLTLAADMVPSLSLLVAPVTGSAASRDLALPVVIAEPDPSQPAICFVPPAVKGASPALRSPVHGLPFPRLRGRFTTSSLAAIRTLARPLDDAELLTPNMALAPDPAAAEWAIDWLVAPTEWDEKLFPQALAALKLQRGVARNRLIFIGDADAEACDAAAALFGDDFVRVADRDEGLALTEAPLVGYLGGGIVLHDARTAAVLASLAVDRSALSASCVVLRSEKRGKHWKTSPIDGGVMPIDQNLVHGAMATNPVEMIWRATYPVVEPPHRLWLSRRQTVRGWHEGGVAEKGFHFVTSLITASHVMGGDPPMGDVAVAALPSSVHWALQAKVLAG